MASACGVALTAMTPMEESNANQGRRQRGAACLLSKQSQRSIGDLDQSALGQCGLSLALSLSLLLCLLTLTAFLALITLIHHLDDHGVAFSTNVIFLTRTKSCTITSYGNINVVSIVNGYHYK
jgi:hypothetical protein